MAVSYWVFTRQKGKASKKRIDQDFKELSEDERDLLL